MKHTKEDYIYKALELACEWIRCNPPACLPDVGFEKYVELFAEGDNRDPKGKDFISYFLEEAVKELNQE